MPQLDKFTFIDQSLSVLFVLFGMYVLNIYIYLPKIVFILRFRYRLTLILKRSTLILGLNFQKIKKFLINNIFSFFAMLTHFNKSLVESYKDYFSIGRFIMKSYISQFNIRKSIK
jgi:hypothetical protein